MHKFFSLEKAETNYQTELKQAIEALDGKKFATIVAQIVEDKLKQLIPDGEWVPIGNAPLGEGTLDAFGVGHPTRMELYPGRYEPVTQIIPLYGLAFAFKESKLNVAVFVMAGVGKVSIKRDDGTVSNRYGVAVRLGMEVIPEWSSSLQSFTSIAKANERIFWKLEKTAEDVLPFVTEEEIREGVEEVKRQFAGYRLMERIAPTPQQIQAWLTETFKKLGADYLQPVPPNHPIHHQPFATGPSYDIIGIVKDPQLVYAIRCSFLTAFTAQRESKHEYRFDVILYFAPTYFRASVATLWGDEKEIYRRKDIDTANEVVRDMKETVEKEIAPAALAFIQATLRQRLPITIYYAEVKKDLLGVLIAACKEVLVESLQQLFSSVCSNIQVAQADWEDFSWKEGLEVALIPTFDLSLSFSGKELEIKDVRIFGPIKITIAYGRGEPRPLIIKKVSFYFLDFAVKDAVFRNYSLIKWFSTYGKEPALREDKVKEMKFSLWYDRDVNERCTNEDEIKRALRKVFSSFVDVILYNPIYLESILLILSALAARRINDELQGELPALHRSNFISRFVMQKEGA